MVNGSSLEYELVGSGEPVLLISPVLADGFLPLVSQPTLTDRYQLIRYHKRGWAASTHTATPVSVGDHAADVAALLSQLGVQRAHIVGTQEGQRLRSNRRWTVRIWSNADAARVVAVLGPSRRACLDMRPLVDAGGERRSRRSRSKSKARGMSDRRRFRSCPVWRSFGHSLSSRTSTFFERRASGVRGVVRRRAPSRDRPSRPRVLISGTRAGRRPSSGGPRRRPRGRRRTRSSARRPGARSGRRE